MSRVSTPQEGGLPRARQPGALRNVVHVLGKFDKSAPIPTGDQHEILVPESITAQTLYGELVRLAPPVKFSETKPYWQHPVLQGAMEGH
jgi:hypothetical protein